VEINLVLPLRPLFRVSGTLRGYPPDQGFNLMAFNSADQPLPVRFQSDPAKGTFNVSGVPSGLVTIVALTQYPRTQQTFYASRIVNITADFSGVHLALLPTTSIPLNVRIEKTRNDPEPAGRDFPRGTLTSFPRSGTNGVPPGNIPVAIVLIPSGHAPTTGQYIPEAVGDAASPSLIFHNVAPGTYGLRVYPANGYYADFAHSGTLDLLTHELTVAPGGAVQPIEVVLRDDLATVNGKVFFGQNPASAVVLAIPESELANFQPIMATGGQFQVDLPPGAYKFLAADTNNWEYGNREVLEKYLSDIRELLLSPNQTATVELNLVQIKEKN
jgi:hypothetical protein